MTESNKYKFINHMKAFLSWFFIFFPHLAAYVIYLFLLYRCMLHNFAGNVEMYGILDAVASGPVESRTSENSTMASL